ncbi:MULTISPECIES: biopolymer transporter ExbD [unclassified Roseibium]|uniref:ExbD/TolR family protein n=1 Tax=unclassified Roseibium TaxID=2629323 RepID=UPI00273D0135|nr:MULTISPECIES: biopolymer transporter ExbD [unclassified Roseibium]
MLRIRKPLGARKRLSLTPLIDVIFILVMFFLLSSTFGVWRPIDVLLGRIAGAEAPTTPQSSNTPSVLITVSGGELQSLDIAINGVRVQLEGVVPELNRLSELGATSVLLIPDRTLDFQDMVDVLDLARTSRMGSINLHLD